MILKHLHDITLSDLPKMEHPFFAAAKVENAFRGEYTARGIRNLGEYLPFGDCDYQYAIKGLLRRVEAGSVFLIHDHAGDTFSPMVAWVKNGEKGLGGRWTPRSGVGASISVQISNAISHAESKTRQLSGIKNVKATKAWPKAEPIGSYAPPISRGTAIGARMTRSSQGGASAISNPTKATKASIPYEQRIRDIYGAKKRRFAVRHGDRVIMREADAVTRINGELTAIDAKYVGTWSGSLRNPNSGIGKKWFARKERKALISQAMDYSQNFKRVIYHSNNQQFIGHYSKVFKRFGLNNIEFKLTP